VPREKWPAQSGRHLESHLEVGYVPDVDRALAASTGERLRPKPGSRALDELLAFGPVESNAVVTDRWESVKADP
jgi:hypothetical protein